LTRAVEPSANRSTTLADKRLNGLEQRLSLLDPERILARGWSITRNAAGDLVTDPDDVAAGSILQTQVAAGEIRSVVSADEEVPNA
jgi:exodeoxyribonuclease VII large subunit